MSDWVATILAGIVIAIGIAGVVVPLLPGLWLIWAAAFVYGLVTDFSAAAWIAMAIITALAVFGTAVVYYLPARKTGEMGMPHWGQAVVAACAVAGFFLIPVVGAFVGLAIGTLGVALIMERDVSDAFAKAWATLMAMVKGAAIQLLVALGMALVWGVWALSVV